MVSGGSHIDLMGVSGAFERMNSVKKHHVGYNTELLWGVWERFPLVSSIIVTGIIILWGASGFCCLGKSSASDGQGLYIVDSDSYRKSLIYEAEIGRVATRHELHLNLRPLFSLFHEPECRRNPLWLTLLAPEPVLTPRQSCLRLLLCLVAPTW